MTAIIYILALVVIAAIAYAVIKRLGEYESRKFNQSMCLQTREVKP